MVTVEVTPAALADLSRLPKVIQERAWKVVRRLRAWPTVSGVVALSGNLAGWYRIRTGDYRIRIRVIGDRLIVDRIGHRKDVYED